MHRPAIIFFFFFNDTATTEIYTLSLHDALPISLPEGSTRMDWEVELGIVIGERARNVSVADALEHVRSEEHTSELQSPCNLVCRLLLEKKNNTYIYHDPIKKHHLAQVIWHHYCSLLTHTLHL